MVLVHRLTTWLPACVRVMVILPRAGGVPTDSASVPVIETTRRKIAFAGPRSVIVDAVRSGSWYANTLKTCELTRPFLSTGYR